MDFPNIEVLKYNFRIKIAQAKADDTTTPNEQAKKTFFTVADMI